MAITTHGDGGTDAADKAPPGAPLVAARGSAIDALKAEIHEIIKDAWHHGFNAGNITDHDFLDSYALADERIDELWPNGRTKPPPENSAGLQTKGTK